MKGERKERQKLTKEGVVFAIIQNGNILLEKRLDPGDKLQGYIIIPGGKTKERESIWGTLSREIKEECDCIPKISSYLSTYSEQEDEINNVRHLFVVNAIEGEISERLVDLKVRDDGSGFEMNSEFELSQLLARRHFGLASMFERAALISAQMELRSTPG